MRYMAVERFRPGAVAEVYRRFAEKGRMMPDGLHYIDAVNEHTLAALLSGEPAPGVDWLHQPPAEIATAYNERIDKLVLQPKAVSN